MQVQGQGAIPDPAASDSPGPNPASDADPYAALAHGVDVLMRRARGLSGALQRELHPNLEAAAYGLLVRINEADPVRVTDLAAYFCTGKPTVSRQIAELKRLGFVESHVNEEDQRSTLVSITPAGRAVLERAVLARCRRVRQALALWSPEDVAQLATLLGRFNEATG